MIASLQGTWHNGTVIVGGVGWRVQVIAEPANEQQVFFHTVCIMRENAWSLYGFAATEEQAVFEALLRVTRVGPQAAMALLRHLGATGVYQAVLAKDVTAISKAPGIGKKTAESIVALCEMPELDLEGPTGDRFVRDLAAALDALGLAGSEHTQQIADVVAAHPEAAEEELIKILLTELR